MADIAQLSFSKGETAPSLAARCDLQYYYSALSRCENFTVLRQGGLSNRAGTVYCDRAVSDVVRLIPFAFSETQSLALALSGMKIRFFYRGAPVVDDSGAVYEIESPYTDAQLADVAYCQNADTIFLVHPDVRPKVLKRYGNTDWALEDYIMNRGPYEDVNTDTSIRMYAALDPDGDRRKDIIVYAIDANGDPVSAFESGRQDALIYLELQDFSRLKPWVASSAVSVGDIRYSDFKVYECIELSGDAGKTVTGPNKPTHADGAEWDGDGDERDGKKYGAKWQYLNDGKLYGRIKTVTSESEAKVRAWYHGLPDVLTGAENASYKWAFAAFSGKNGFPSTVTFYQQRLVFAGTKTSPQTVWMSGVNQFDFFGVSSPAVDSDSLTFSLTSNRINRIVGFVPLKALVTLTEGASFAIYSQEGGLSASTLAIDIQSNIGAARIQPLSIAESALFVQAKGGAIRDMGYSFQSDNYTGGELSIMAHHLFDGKRIVDWAYSQAPDSCVYIVLDSGEMIIMTLFREQEVCGFARFVTDGRVISVCSIPEETHDAVYIAVKRAGGVLIERLENRQSSDVFLDSAIMYSGTEVDAVSGLDHLNGQTITIQLDDGSTETARVINNAVSLSRPSQSVVAGLPYTSLMTTLDIQSDQQPGAGVRRKSVCRAFIRSIGSEKYGVEINNRMYRPKETPQNRNETEGERIMEVNLEDRYGRSGRVSLIHDAPEPLMVLSLTLSMEARG